MPLIKDKGEERAPECPYCRPYNYPLRWDEHSKLLYCVKCHYAVKVQGMDYPDMKFEKTPEIYIPPFHWEQTTPHKKHNGGVPSMYWY